MTEEPLANRHTAAPDDMRSVVFLLSPDRRQIVLLRRAAWKSFAPGRWTGIGGRLEGDELLQPALGALRELREETGLTLDDLSDWRFVADVVDPGAEVRLVYFTAIFATEPLPLCNEGTLYWVALDEYVHYDLIENTRVVLDTLVADGLLAGVEASPLCGTVLRDGVTLQLARLPPGS